MKYRMDEVASFVTAAAIIRTEEYFKILPQLQAAGLAEPEAVEAVEDSKSVANTKYSACTQEELEYIKFMYDPENIFRCGNCPENIDSDNWEGKLPCGQQNCCVECHCRESDSDLD